MLLKSLIALALILCTANTDMPDSLFISTYRSYSDSHRQKWHRMIERKTEDRISPADSVFFIPCFTLHKGLDWDYSNPANNEKNARWDILDQNNWLIDSFILRKEDGNAVYYENVGRSRKEQFVTYSNEVIQKLLAEVHQLNPEGMFKIYDIPAWFLIMDGEIKALELHNRELELHEDAIAYLKGVFTDRLFIPVISGDEY